MGALDALGEVWFGSCAVPLRGVPVWILPGYWRAVASREEKLQTTKKRGLKERFLRKEGLYYKGGGDSIWARNCGAPYTERVGESSFVLVRASGTPPGV